MKRIVVVMMLALLLAGCHGKKKEVYYQTDVEQDMGLRTEVDWVGLYVRCHELDSLKKGVEIAGLKAGDPLPALPDSLTKLWEDMTTKIVMRDGEGAFALYDSHREDIEKYLRLDFLNYGFITKVYLPYKATVSSREEYGKICIEELEKEFSKAQETLRMGGGIPSHYDDMLLDLFLAYVNYDRLQEADGMCGEIMAYYKAMGKENTLQYADMLGHKAELYHRMGSNYTSVISANQAIKMYDDFLKSGTLGEDQAKKVLDSKAALESKLKEWQKK
ncbi:MAG: hypothetical protein J6X89_08425 [Bacteroidales bacterium]|nr:hypothetical protein [Bacteroidales bacterium]